MICNRGQFLFCLISQKGNKEWEDFLSSVFTHIVYSVIRALYRPHLVWPAFADSRDLTCLYCNCSQRWCVQQAPKCYMSRWISVVHPHIYNLKMRLSKHMPLACLGCASNNLQNRAILVWLHVLKAALVKVWCLHSLLQGSHTIKLCFNKYRPSSCPNLLEINPSSKFYYSRVNLLAENPFL